IRVHDIDTTHRGTVQVVDGDRLTGQRVRGLERGVVGQTARRIVTTQRVVVARVIPAAADADPREQLVLDADRIIPGVLTGDIGILASIRGEREAAVEAPADLVVLAG